MADGPARAAPPEVSLTPVELARDIADRRGVLCFVGGSLAAVLARLDDEAHGELRGCWVVEVGFGACDVSPAPVFQDLAAVEAWLTSVAGAT